MKKHYGVLWILMLQFMVVAIPCMALEYKLTSGITATYYGSDDDDNGRQLFIPVELSTDYKDWSFQMQTAVIHSLAENALDQDGELTGLSDTRLNTTYKRSDLLPVDILFSLDMNIPTGKTNLDQEEGSLFADSDLFPFKPYGEGFNINPSVIFANTWDKWSAGVGIGYTLRGEYDYSSGLKNYDPGDIFIITGEADYVISDGWTSGFYVEYGIFSEDKVDNKAVYQQGDFLLAGADVTYKQSKWDMLFNLEMIIRTELINDDEIKNTGDPSFVTENKNNTGDEYKALAVYRRFIDDISTAKGFLEIGCLSDNGYKSSDPLYFGKRNKLRIGGSYAREFSPVLEGEIGVEIFYLDADKSYFNEKDRTYTGITLGFLVSRYF